MTRRTYISKPKGSRTHNYKTALLLNCETAVLIKNETEDRRTYNSKSVFKGAYMDIFDVKTKF